jgi:hypothetical protein
MRVDIFVQGVVTAVCGICNMTGRAPMTTPRASAGWRP